MTNGSLAIIKRVLLGDFYDQRMLPVRPGKTPINHTDLLGAVCELAVLLVCDLSDV